MYFILTILTMFSHYSFLFFAKMTFIVKAFEYWYLGFLYILVLLSYRTPFGIWTTLRFGDHHYPHHAFAYLVMKKLECVQAIRYLIIWLQLIYTHFWTLTMTISLSIISYKEKILVFLCIIFVPQYLVPLALITLSILSGKDATSVFERVPANFIHSTTDWQFSLWWLF